MTTTNALQFPISEAPAMGQPLKVAEGVYWLRMPLPFALGRSVSMECRVEPLMMGMVRLIFLL